MRFISFNFDSTNEAEDRHKEIPPNTIRVGDIVEAQLSFKGI